MPVTIIRAPRKETSQCPPSVWQEPKTTPFQCMLAASEIPTDEQVEALLGCHGMLASYKLDGIRCNHHYGVAKSRTMIDIPNKYVQGYFAAQPAMWHGLDGELTVGGETGNGTMNRTTSGINTIEGTPNFTFNLFEDFSYRDHALARYGEINRRFAMLRKAGLMRVNLIEQVLIKDLQSLKAYYKKALALKYEGLILKDPYGHYKNGRSTLLEGLLLKWKEFIYYEARIIGVTQGTKNNNPDIRSNTGKAKRSSAKAGKAPVEAVGSFQVEAINGPYKGVRFSAGPGALTKLQLKALWVCRAQLPGQVVTIKSQEFGVKDKPRYPGVHAFRPDFDMPQEGV